MELGAPCPITPARCHAEQREVSSIPEWQARGNLSKFLVLHLQISASHIAHHFLSVGNDVSGDGVGKEPAGPERGDWLEQVVFP